MVELALAAGEATAGGTVVVETPVGAGALSALWLTSGVLVELEIAGDGGADETAACVGVASESAGAV
ncbi:MAG: hypothetical protein WCB68_15145 [Pyrinomonadaceae bacterium]